MKKFIILLVVSAWLPSLACNMLGALPAATPTPTTTFTPTLTSTPTLTPTPTITPTPTLTPTPEGSSIYDPQEGYSLYVPDGYRSACDKGICLVVKENTNFGGMNFNLIHVPPSSGLTDINDAVLGLFIGGMLQKQSDLGLVIEDKSKWTPVSMAGMDGQAIDFTGVGGTPKRSMEGQIVGFSPAPEYIFWAIGFADTSSDPDAWKNHGRDVFHFILNSATFTQ